MFDWIYNIFGNILSFFGNILSFFNQITGSYALALILYALMFKILFLPFGIKTQKNQIAMAKLRPKMAKIEKKYAGRTDRATMQKKQQEIMELQQKEGYSALSGCLPLLLQFPIIIFLYNVIRNPLSYIAKWDKGIITAATDYFKSAFELKTLDEIKLIDYLQSADAGVRATLNVTEDMMAKIPEFNFLGANLASNPSLNPINILVLIPVFAAFFQWLSMFLMKKWQPNPMQGDAQNQMSMKIMDLMFPALTLWMAFNFSGMLGLYWIYQSIFAVLQQYILCKTMPLPTFTPEELKEMEKAEKAKAQAQRAALNEKPKYKSLHFIDDEDYEELPDVKKNETDKKPLNGLDVADLKDDKNN